MARIDEIVFDCEQAPLLARFWADVLDGYQVLPYDDAEIDRLAAMGLSPETDPTVTVDGPGPTLFFQQVPERKYENNRVHLDVIADNRQTEVDRLRERGASVQRESERYTVMLDPEGNQFCILEAE